MMSFIKDYPVPISGLTLGMLGLAAFWQGVLANTSLGAVLMVCVGLLAVLLLMPLLIKFIRYPVELWKAMQHPTIGSVVPTLAMSLMLISHAGSLLGVEFSSCLWLFAVVLHGFFLVVFSYYRISHFKWDDMVPSWFVPPIGIVVACLTVPTPALIVVAHVIVWVGLVMYGILLPLMIHRLCVEPSVDDARKPTLAIMAAPASLTLSGYLTIIPHPNVVLTIFLLSLSITMIVSVYIMLLRLLRLNFSPAFSAFTFPLAISATAALKASFWMQSEPLLKLQSHILYSAALIEGVIATCVIGYVLCLYLHHIKRIAHA